MKKILTTLGLFAIGMVAANVSAQEEVEIPAGYISIYDAALASDPAALINPSGAFPCLLDGLSNLQLMGPGAGWGDATNFNYSAYKTIAFHLTFEDENRGKQVACRISYNGNTAGGGGVMLFRITLPTEGNTHLAKYDISQYANANGEILSGGTFFYNGGENFAFTFENPATAVTTIDYIALSSEGTSVKNVIADDADALVDVYSLTGVAVRKNVKKAEATQGLTPGIYVVDGKKVVVRSDY